MKITNTHNINDHTQTYINILVYAHSRSNAATKNLQKFKLNPT